MNSFTQVCLEQTCAVVTFSNLYHTTYPAAVTLFMDLSSSISINKNKQNFGYS